MRSKRTLREEMQLRAASVIGRIGHVVHIHQNELGRNRDFEEPTTDCIMTDPGQHWTGAKHAFVILFEELTEAGYNRFIALLKEHDKLFAIRFPVYENQVWGPQDNNILFPNLNKAIPADLFFESILLTITESRRNSVLFSARTEAIDQIDRDESANPELVETAA